MRSVPLLVVLGVSLALGAQNSWSKDNQAEVDPLIERDFVTFTAVTSQPVTVSIGVTVTVPIAPILVTETLDRPVTVTRRTFTIISITQTFTKFETVYVVNGAPASATEELLTLLVLSETVSPRLTRGFGIPVTATKPATVTVTKGVGPTVTVLSTTTFTNTASRTITIPVTTRTVVLPDGKFICTIDPRGVPVVATVTVTVTSVLPPGLAGLNDTTGSILGRQIKKSQEDGMEKRDDVEN